METPETLQNILTRRSIRRYKDKKIPEEIIFQILRAAMYAPSAVNKQPWHFIIINDPAILKKIMEVHPYASFLDQASHAVVVCGDELLQHDTGYYVVDCGAATQNLLLAAHQLGIGSCWIGLHPREERKKKIKELFELPDHIQPFALVSLGYSNENKPMPERFNLSKIHFNSWGNQ